MASSNAPARQHIARTSKPVYQRVMRSALSLVLSAALLLLAPMQALASVEGTDMVGNESVTDRGLTVTQAPNVDATNGLLIASDGTVLWSRFPNDSISIASTTKMMTAVVAVENYDLNMQITIPAEAAEVGESSAHLVEGTTTTLHNLLYGMLIESGNDAAVAIAIGCAGSEEAFVAKMNAKAAEIGMTNTYFENPDGLEQGNHHSCAADMALLAQYFMKKQVLRDIVCNATYDIDLGYGETTLESTNELLSEYDGCIGIKTGFTDEAGYCLAGAASRNGLEIYALVYGSSTESSRFTTSAGLFDWAFEHYVNTALSDTTTTVANVASLDWNGTSIPVTCKDAVSAYVLDYNGAVSQHITLSDVHGAVSKGDVLGTITWTQGGTVIGTSQLIAAADCAEPTFWEKIAIWFQRTFQGAKAAENEILIEPVTIQLPYPEATDQTS